MGGSPNTRRKYVLIASGAVLLSCHGEYVPFSEACSNGDLEVGEICDDQNEVDGDGCNNDCTLSGTEQWTSCIESFADPAVRAAGVAFDWQGNPILVATIVSEEGGPAKIWTRGFNPEGEVRWTSVCCDEPDTDFVAVDAAKSILTADKTIVIGGRINGGAHSDASLVLVLDGNGDRLWQATATDMEPVLAVTAGSVDRVYAAVERDGKPVLLGLGSESWNRTIETASDGQFTARALDGFSSLYAAGVIEGGAAKQCGWLGRYDSGQFLWQSEDGNGRYLDLAVNYAGGDVYALAMTPCSGSAQTTVHHYDSAGIRSSELEFPAPHMDATGLGLAIDNSQRLTILAEGAGGPTLTRIAADGSMLWTTAVPMLKAQTLAVAAATGHVALGGVNQKGGKVDVCLRYHSP